MPFDDWLIHDHVYTPKQLEMLEAVKTHRLTMVAANNRLGKTDFGCCFLSECVLGLQPEVVPVPELTYGSGAAGIYVMAVSLDADTARESMEEYFRTYIPEERIKESNRREGLTDFRELHHPLCPETKKKCSCNGARLVIRTEGQRRRSFQGSQPHVIWFDEEPMEDIYRESRIRLRKGHKIRILMTFTPLMGITWLHDALWLKAGELEAARITATIYEAGFSPCLTCHCGPGEAPQECPRCRGYGHEPFYEAEEIAALERELTGAEREARLYGKWGLIGGQRMFSDLTLKRIEPGLRRGTRDLSGVLVFQKPIEGHTYAMGIDVGYGRGGDDTAISLFDASDGDEAAVWHHNKVEPVDVADIVRELSHDYFQPLIVCERQGPGEALLEHLKLMGELWLYHQRVLDRRGYVHSMRLGYWTNYQGRTRLLDHFAAAVGKSLMTVRHHETWSQMSRMLFDPKAGRFEPQAGKDDLVFSKALAREGMRHLTTQVRVQPDTTPYDDYLEEKRQAAKRGPANRRVRRFPLESKGEKLKIEARPVPTRPPWEWEE